jgi:pre-rRNA-processing protein TSR3
LNIEHWILDIDGLMSPPVLIIVRRGEAPAKCTVRPLRGTPGLDFLSYPLRIKPALSRHLLLAPDAPALSPADAGRPLLLLDASWRHAATMRKAVEPVEARCIPPGWQTAYPRRSKTHADPGAGLATVEALYAALCTLGFRNDSLLRFYPWRDAFLDLNRPLLPPA